MYLKILITSIYLIMVANWNICYAYASKKTLMDDLVDNMLTDYSKDNRPYKEHNKPLDLKMRLYIGKLIKLDTQAQCLTAHGVLILHWVDKRLAWDNETEHQDILDVVIPANKLWVPELTLRNSASLSMFRADFIKLSKATVYQNGTVIWMPGGEFMANCKMNIKYFPYDDQICTIEIGTWAYDKNQILINSSYPHPFNLTSHYHKNSEWELLNSTHKDYLDYSNSPYICYFLHYSRAYTFYNTHFLAFMEMLLFLLAFVLLVPVESGDKIKTGIVILVSFSVIYNTIKTFIPETSEAVPVITIMVLVVMALNLLVVIESMIVTTLYYYHKTDRISRVKLCKTEGYPYSQLEPTENSQHAEEGAIAATKSQQHTGDQGNHRQLTAPGGEEDNDNNNRSQAEGAGKNMLPDNDCNSNYSQILRKYDCISCFIYFVIFVILHIICFIYIHFTDTVNFNQFVEDYRGLYDDIQIRGLVNMFHNNP